MKLANPVCRRIMWDNGKFSPNFSNMSPENVLLILAQLYVLHSVMMCSFIDILTPQDVHMGCSSRDIRYPRVSLVSNLFEVY